MCVCQGCAAAGTNDSADDDDAYSLLYANNTWYVLLRLFYVLCDRLSYFLNHADQAIAAAAAERPDIMETATALCLKTPREYQPHTVRCSL